MTEVRLEWEPSSSAELRAPNGEVLIAVVTPSLARMFHREEGQLVVFSRPATSLDGARASALAYGKAWLAGHTSAEEVYGSMEAALSEVNSP